jgi:hypothetical protein
VSLGFTMDGMPVYHKRFQKKLGDRSLQERDRHLILIFYNCLLDGAMMIMRAPFFYFLY